MLLAAPCSCDSQQAAQAPAPTQGGAFQGTYDIPRNLMKQVVYFYTCSKNRINSCAVVSLICIFFNAGALSVL
jgi:hypothetical protein